jgi:small-conductance mechanosensitive channel
MADLFGVDVSTIIWIIVIAVVAIALERFFTRYLSRFAKRTKLELSVSNNLLLTVRIIILIGALGFASQKTLGNFMAGLFLLAARPFRVGDYVRIGTVEGIVQEITINYTKVLTIGNNTVAVSNLQILDRDITNYAYQSRMDLNLYCYTFEIGFDHRVSTEKIAEIFSEVFQRHIHMLPRQPSYMLTRSSAFERVYVVYLYVEHPEDIFTLRPQIAEAVFKRWDIERAQTPA